MSREIEYKNLIAFHPGSYVEEIIDDLNMSQAEFATRLGVSAKTISKIINGEDGISRVTANKLAKVTGISIQTWLNLQAKYDEKLSEIQNEKNQDELRVSKLVDSKYLKDNHILENRRYSANEKIIALRQILNLADLTQLCRFNAEVSYRRAKNEYEEKSIVGSNVMLELANNIARNVTNKKYDKNKLEQTLPKIKAMNLEEPNVFYQKICNLLVECGIVLVVLPHLPGARLNGATKKFKNGSVLLMVTDRAKDADIFWFSLIHELGHIYFEDFYSDSENQAEYQAKESKADKFAAEFFIPSTVYNHFKRQNVFTDDSIRAFAESLNVSAGIVVGRLQADNLIPHNSFNYLKIKYQVSLALNSADL